MKKGADLRPGAIDSPYFDGLTIKGRLIVRFFAAKSKFGRHWKKILAEKDPFFNTTTGKSYIVKIAGCISNGTTKHIDKMERIAVSLEKIAGITHPSHQYLATQDGVPGALYISIAQRLLARFEISKKALGDHWRETVKASDPYFLTNQGRHHLFTVVGAMSKSKVERVDHMERIVIAMEMAAGIDIQSVV